MTSAQKPLQILVLYDRLLSVASTVFDHIDSFRRYSRHDYFYAETLGDFSSSIDLDRFDVVIVHYTLVASMEFYLSRHAREKLSKCRALKAVFIQDEYRFVNKTIAALRELGADLLFTCVPPSQIEKVYSEQSLPGVTKLSVLTGYVPERLLELPVVPIAQRPIDIGYRSRKVPAWLGKLGQEKSEIANHVLADAAGTGLIVDISAREEDRLYGTKWIDFVRSCKAMLGTESGASVFDFTGEIQAAVDAHEAREPNVDFQTLHDLYFTSAEGQIDLAQISPRCFEASALGTLMILYEGQYSGILEPWRHYLPLKKDHSNFLELVSLLKKDDYVTEIVTRARTEIALNPKYSFRQAVEDIDRSIETALKPSMRAKGMPYGAEEFRAAAVLSWSNQLRRIRRNYTDAANRFVFGFLLSGLPSSQRDLIKAWVRRHYKRRKAQPQ